MSEFNYHPAVVGAETDDFSAGTVSRIVSAVTEGAPAAAISGALSIANTLLDYAGADQISIEGSIENILGAGTADYYKANKDAIDLVGAIGFSIIPGSVGIKGLQLLRAGTATTAAGRFLGYAANRKNYYLQQALKEVAADGGVVKNLLVSSARRRQVGFEVLDQALLGSAAELAVVATMHDSPIFDNYSIKDFTFNAALGTVLSGGIGGALGSIAAKGILKTAASDIQKELRLVDTVFDPKRMGLSKGTELAAYMESMLTLPSGAEAIGFKYKYDGAWKHVPGGLKIAEPINRAKENATKLAQQEINIRYNGLAEGDARTGQAFAQFVSNSIEAARLAGKDSNEIVELLHGYLNNVDKIGRVNLEQYAFDQRKFYLNFKPAGATSQEKFLNLLSTKRTKTTSKNAYYLEEGVLADDIVMLRAADIGTQNTKDIWKMHPNADAVQMLDGTFRFNPKSQRIKRVGEDPYIVRMFLEAETGTLSPEVVATFGDIINPKNYVNKVDYLATDGFSMQLSGTKVTTIDTAPLEGSARFAWASQRSINDLVKTVGNTIDSADIPVMQRISELAADSTTNTKLLDSLTINHNGTTLKLADIPNLTEFIDNVRLTMLRQQLSDLGMLNKAIPETRVIAANLGVSRDWVEQAIDSGYTKTTAKSLPTEAALNQSNIMMQWNFATVRKAMLPEEAYAMNMGPSHLATKELSRVYQTAIATQTGHNAVLGALGSDASYIIDVERFMPADRSAAQTAEASGAGATMFGASNASYGKRAELAAQELGKNVATLTNQLRDAVIESLSPNINRIRESARSAAELGALTTALRKSPYRFVINPESPYSLVTTEAVWAARRAKTSIANAVAKLGDGHLLANIAPDVFDFVKKHTQINATMQNKFTLLANASGHVVPQTGNMPIVYVPPISTVRYPYHAFVRTKDKVGLSSGVSMITAKSEQQLRALAAKVSDDFDVLYKSDTDNYFKARGEYEYDRTLNQAAVNSELARRGVLADFFPETRAENILEDYLQWHAKQQEKLVRDSAQVRNRRFFNELNFLSKQYRSVSESVTRGIGSKFRSKIADPFGDYIKTALNISKQQEFPLLDGLNEVLDNVGRIAGDAIQAAFVDAKKGLLPWDEANKVLDKYGLGSPYKGWDSYLIANEPMSRNVLRGSMQKANLWLATTTLRLDFANSLVNIISTPIMLGTELSSIRGMLKAGDPLAGKLNELMSVAVPGHTKRMPSTTKLIGDAINNYFGKNKNALIQQYRDIGAIKDVSTLFHEIMDQITYAPGTRPNVFAQRVDAAIERGSTITGNTFAEEFTRFVSADVMRQITDVLKTAGKMTAQEQNAYISTFVNRVQGNYVTSQRPVLFQGTSGAAVSLFQTYAFNVLQQLYRHMEAGDKKTLAIFAGLQSTVFGFNGLPFFDAVNTHLIGGYMAANPEHKDAYSVLPSFNKEVGEMMLYGLASAFPLFSGSSPALFTRGDINPRHLSIIPLNPLDVPAVSASLKLFNTVVDTGSKLVQGADVSETLLQGLEHQGWNRPLAGLAQLLAGQSTTSSGALISAASDMEVSNRLAALTTRTFTIDGVSRLMGARPMDEAVALNTLYRQKTYQAMDRARIERLGTVVKTKLYAGEFPTDEEMDDFMLRYARAGGRIENFTQSMQRWTRDANVSIVNQLADKLSSPYGQTIQSIMGGERLPDYTNQE